jgi:hypothetical protein
MTVIDLRTRQVLPEVTFERVSAEAFERYGTSGVEAAWKVFKAAMADLTEKLRQLDVAAMKDYTMYMWMCGQLLDYAVDPKVFREFQQQVGSDVEALSKDVEGRNDIADEQTERLTVLCLSCKSLFQSLALRYPGTP